MTQMNLNKLLKLSEYMNTCTIVFPQGSDQVEFKNLQTMINQIYDGSINDHIPEFDTYFITNAFVQNSLLEDGEDILIIFMV